MNSPLFFLVPMVTSAILTAAYSGKLEKDTLETTEVTVEGKTFSCFRNSPSKPFNCKEINNVHNPKARLRAY